MTAEHSHPSVLAPLDRKLMRGLWRMRGQAMAIAAVIALGVLMLVMMDGLVNSLEETKRAYYERYRLADIFAPVKRAPKFILNDVKKIAGVASVEGRINGRALINLAGVAVPIHAQALSLPGHGEPRLNDIFLVDGRRLDPTQENEILLLEAFALAHELSPGATISATMNGARRNFQIVGLVQSPEFLYSTPPGELMPDDARFAVIWMTERALAAAFDLDGAFNEALLSLTRDADEQSILDTLDRTLNTYGGLGSFSVTDHVSDRFVQEEIEGLKVSSKSVPPIFLAVAAFLLNIVITRMIESERGQIGLLKAFGYTSTEIGVHYFKLVISIAAGGAILGCLLGVLAGRSLVDVYLIYYKFPFLVFEINPRAFIIGLSVSVLAASAGGAMVLIKVFGLTPAVAMRPPAPTDYSQAANFGHVLKAILDQPSRMVIRRLIRQPLRSVLAVIGIATGMSLSVAMIGVLGGFDQAVETSFGVVDRSDVTVTLVEPYSDKIIYELGRMEGVVKVEPFRTVPAILKHGLYSHRGAINGFIRTAQLNRAIDSNLAPILMRKDGVILAKSLADKLHIQPGELLTIEVREGRRPTLDVPVVDIADIPLGSPAYMDIETLNRILKEPNRISGAYLRIDQAFATQIYRTLKDMPSIAGVSLKSEAREAFQKMLDTGAGAIRYVMAAIAGIITFGIVYNSARIAFAERSRDLASLRVIGFSQGETAFVLLGELAVITLAALPIGSLLGHYLALAIAQGFSTDLYQVPAAIEPEGYGIAILAVLLASVVSGWLVKRDINKIDMVSALKTRE